MTKNIIKKINILIKSQKTSIYYGNLQNFVHN